MNNIKPCWKGSYNFLTCNDPDKCREEDERLEVCTLNNFEELEEAEKKVLYNDALNEGFYRIADIRDHVRYLNENSPNIKVGRKNENMKKLREKHGEISPLDLDPEEYDLEEREYHVRASEFNSTCLAARLISKMDEEKIEEALQAEGKFLDKKYAESGTALHKVSQGGLDKNHIELPVWYEHEGYIISGHVDAAYVTEKNPIPFIIDFKRAVKPAKSYDDQGLIYLAALNQRIGLDSEYGVSDMVSHASFDSNMKDPRHNLTLIYLPESDKRSRSIEDNQRLGRTLESLEESVRKQKSLISDDEFKSPEMDMCEGCFPSTRTICRFLDGKNPREFLDEKVLL